MKISKRDALLWFRFFAQMPEDEPLMPHQRELAYAVIAQIETAAEARFDSLMREIPHLKSLNGRTYYVGSDEKFSKGCRSCLIGTGLSAVRKTNKCSMQDEQMQCSMQILL